MAFGFFKRKGKDAVDYGKKVVGADAIKENAEGIKNMAKVLLNPKEAIKKSKKETFVDAKNRLKVNDLDILQNYKNMVYSFYISFFFSTVCFIGIIYNLFFLKQIIAALSMFAIMGVCLANSFRFSFRAFQIKHQKLCSVNEWWNRSSEWFPPLKIK